MGLSIHQVTARWLFAWAFFRACLDGVRCFMTVTYGTRDALPKGLEYVNDASYGAALILLALAVLAYRKPRLAACGACVFYSLLFIELVACYWWGIVFWGCFEAGNAVLATVAVLSSSGNAAVLRRDPATRREKLLHYVFGLLVWLIAVPTVSFLVAIGWEAYAPFCAGFLVLLGWGYYVRNRRYWMRLGFLSGTLAACGLVALAQIFHW